MKKTRPPLQNHEKNIDALTKTNKQHKTTITKTVVWKTTPLHFVYSAWGWTSRTDCLIAKVDGPG